MRDEDEPGHLGVEQPEVREREQRRADDPDAVHQPAPDPVGDVAEQRDADEPDGGGHQGVVEQLVPLDLEDRRPVGEDERDEHVERRLLGHPDEGRGEDLPRLGP